MTDKFPLAYVFFGLFGFWSVLCWFASDAVERKRKEIAKLKDKAGKNDPKLKKLHEYEEARAIYLRRYCLGVTVVLLCPMVVCLLVVHSIQREYELHQPIGVLVPSHDPTPNNECESASLPAGALRVLLGPMAAIGTVFPQTAIMLNDDPILTFNRDSDGNVSLTTDIYDENDDIVVEIKNNHFRISNDAFDVIHPDFSTLAVIIKHDKQQVLDVHYLNRTTISVQGIFRHPHDPLEVAKGSVIFNGQPIGFRDVCSENSGKADFAFSNR